MQIRPGLPDGGMNCCKLFFVSPAFFALMDVLGSKKKLSLAPQRRTDVAIVIHSPRSELLEPL